MEAGRPAGGQHSHAGRRGSREPDAKGRCKTTNGTQKSGFLGSSEEMTSPDPASSVRVQGRPTPTVDDGNSVSSSPDPLGMVSTELSCGAYRAG